VWGRPRLPDIGGYGRLNKTTTCRSSGAAPHASDYLRETDDVFHQLDFSRTHSASGWGSESGVEHGTGAEVMLFGDDQPERFCGDSIWVYAKSPKHSGTLRATKSSGTRGFLDGSPAIWTELENRGRVQIADNTPAILPNYVSPDVFQRQKSEILNSGRLPVPIREFSESGWNVD
jgi:hypothetical protein